MSKKENQRIALTKRLLKENLLRLMSEKNIQTITVSELCKAAEINRSTFYNHYSCPADVLAEIENSVITDLEQIWEKESFKQNWTLDKRIEALCTYLQENSSLARLLFRDSDTNSRFASLLFNSSHVNATYEQVFFDAKNQDSTRLIITFLKNGAYHMIRQWLLEDIPITPKEMGKLVHFMGTQGWEKASGDKQSEPKF